MILTTVAIPPINISATVKFITKYKARVRRLLFFTKRIIDRRFTATTATFITLFLFNSLFSSLQKEIKSNKVWLVEKGKLGGELRGLTSTP